MGQMRKIKFPPPVIWRAKNSIKNLSLSVVHSLRTQFGGGEDYDYTNYDENNAGVGGGAGRRQYGVGNRPNYNFHASNRRLRLIWDEKGRSLEYTLKVDSQRRGFWMTSGPQKGKNNFTCFVTGVLKTLFH
jgi:hypothetical protein